jgi:hypothetical protein
VGVRVDLTQLISLNALCNWVATVLRRVAVCPDRHRRDAPTTDLQNCLGLRRRLASGVNAVRHGAILDPPLRPLLPNRSPRKGPEHRVTSARCPCTTPRTSDTPVGWATAHLVAKIRTTEGGLPVKKRVRDTTEGVDIRGWCRVFEVPLFRRSVGEPVDTWLPTVLGTRGVCGAQYSAPSQVRSFMRVLLKGRPEDLSRWSR